MNLYASILSGNVVWFDKLLSELRKQIDIDHTHLIIEDIPDQPVTNNLTGYKAVHWLYNEGIMDYDEILYHQDIHNKILKNKDQIDKQKQIISPFAPSETDIRRYIEANRHYSIYDYSTKRYLTESWIRLFVNQFDRIQPDLFITHDIGSPITKMQFDLTKKFGGFALWWMKTRLGNRYAFKINVFDDYPEIHRQYTSSDLFIQKEYKDLARQYILKVRDSNMGLPRIRINGETQSIENPNHKKFKRGIKYWKQYYFNNLSNNYKQEAPLLKTFEEIYLIAKRNLLKRKCIYDEFDKMQSYVYYPLHMQPEWSTLILDPAFKDQLHVIKRIRESMPISHKLYVKEHPFMIKNKPRNLFYYQKILKMSDVYLIDPQVDSRELIQNSDLTITISGTAGFEAVFYKKPVIVLGKPHYRFIKNVRESDVVSLPDDINQMINFYSHNENDLVRYVASIIKHSFHFNKNNPESVNDMADLVVNIIKKYANS